MLVNWETGQVRRAVAVNVFFWPQVYVVAAAGVYGSGPPGELSTGKRPARRTRMALRPPFRRMD